MRATITKIHDLKFGKHYKAWYRRTEFALDNGTWAATDICEGYRNRARWGIPLKVGQSFTGVKLVPDSDPQKVDADSPVQMDNGPACIYIPKKKVKINPQGELFT